MLKGSQTPSNSEVWGVFPTPKAERPGARRQEVELHVGGCRRLAGREAEKARQLPGTAGIGGVRILHSVGAEQIFVVCFRNEDFCLNIETLILFWFCFGTCTSSGFTWGEFPITNRVVGGHLLSFCMNGPWFQKWTSVWQLRVHSILEGSPESLGGHLVVKSVVRVCLGFLGLRP